MGKRKIVITPKDELIAELVSISDHKIVAIWAADCAERVLPYFEERYPGDHRPRKAIDAGRAWVRGELKMTEARKSAFAAHAAARDASLHTEATSAARAAGHAAATAHVAKHAVAAASYAVTAIRDAIAPTEEDDAIIEEREWQFQHLLVLKED